MNRDLALDELQTEHIDHLLSAWHHWCLAERIAIGYPKTAAGCAQYRASRQYDDQNGSLDHDADNAMSQAVDGVIHQMPDPWRGALHMEGRNLTSMRVWVSQHIPAEMVELVTRQAKKILWGELAKLNLV